jgi:DNA-binding MarR family transcriptional regulator
MPKVQKVKSGRTAGAASESGGVADQLHSAAIHLLRHLREEDLALGLGPLQLSALSVLVFGGPQTIGALARKEQVAAPTISRLVDALVGAGLAQRKASVEDGRSILVSATAAGTRLMHGGRARRVLRLQSLLAGLSSEELQTVARASSLLAGLLRR